MLVYDHHERVSTLGVALAASTLALVLLRTGMAFRANARLLDASRIDAVTDALTGLGNRRKLLRDLDPDAGGDGRAALLMIFDLDGFKHYNDTYGHPAGDSLLERLAVRLDRAAAAGWATTYRLGGDEFCLLGEPGPDPEAAIDAAARALGERGRGLRRKELVTRKPSPSSPSALAAASIAASGSGPGSPSRQNSSPPRRSGRRPPRRQPASSRTARRSSSESPAGWPYVSL